MIGMNGKKLGLLPLSIQDFIKVRETGCCYADKNSLIYKLINGSGSVFFLSRPRRFGKSLLCSTLETIFEGKRELFGEIAGRPALAITETDWDWKEHPVIKFDLSPADFTQGEQQLDYLLLNYLRIAAKRYGVAVRGESLNVQFMNLIMDLEEHCQEKVVVIIDEYDKPLLDTYELPEIHEKIKNNMRGFYGVIKSLDRYLRFVFLTGITKFSKVNIFSNLNQMVDLSLDPRYADLCGLTEDELLQTFAPHIEDIYTTKNMTYEQYLDKLRTFYNGYRFTKKDLKVYNPFGLLLHFNSGGDFLPYWFETGSPTYLINMIKKQKINILDIPKKYLHFHDFQRYDVDKMRADVLLYQTGYLTISNYCEEDQIFEFDYPNEEVRSSFMKSLIEQYFQANEDKTDSLVFHLPKYLNEGNIADSLKVLEQYLASIPYELIEKTENYYQTVVHIVFSMFGLSCQSEVHTSNGRLDALVVTKNFIYCFEFKIDKSAKEALAQIDFKRYTFPYQDKGKKIFKVGVNFETKIRNISEWEIQ
jgi:hypothetical protein